MTIECEHEWRVVSPCPECGLDAVELVDVGRLAAAIEAAGGLWRGGDTVAHLRQWVLPKYYALGKPDEESVA